ncbi:MAG TPA: gamma-glutamyltransferase, partial [Thermomicrobiales bacterium]|nr:gamma-glutamyltransferase [Thermomicrobiales bacterium]
MLSVSTTVGFPNQSIAATHSWERRRPFPTYATTGMIGAAHPLTVEAGLYILRSGGNAIDAAVGAGLVAAVVMPEMCGLGGDLFAVVHRPNPTGGKGDVVSVQGSGISPRSASIEHMRKHGREDGLKMPYRGALAIGVPGMVDAYFKLLEKYGTKSFAEIAEPAIAHARDGFAVMPHGAASLAGTAPELANDPAAAAVFLAGGKPVGAGEKLVQADLARTLEELGRDGVDSFYRGAIARRILDYLTSVGGLFTAEEFAEHTTDFTDPVATTYRGQTVYQTAIPSQGLILLESLNIIEQGEIDPDLSPETIHLLIEAKKRAYADRLAYTADPNFFDSPIETLLSKPWAASRYASIDLQQASTNVPAGEYNDGDTTYLNVVDKDGMMVSLIQSVSSSFGSCVVGGDTGVVLNNRVGRGFSLVDGHPNIYA